MLRTLFGIFVLLHGLVHLWYVVLSQQLVEFQAEMGWTGESWLFTSLFGTTSTRRLATLLYALAAVGFVVGGIGLLARQEWWRPTIIGSAAFSAVIVVLFWDGGMQKIVEKGLLGFVISAALLILLLASDWPSF
jgi:hypothetical protein